MPLLANQSGQSTQPEHFVETETEGETSLLNNAGGSLFLGHKPKSNPRLCCNVARG